MIFQNELNRHLRSGGEKIAIQQGNKSISYSQLLGEANSVTEYLLGKELPAQAPVGILLGDRTEMIVAMIGTINARGTFVFLDAGLPTARLAAIRDQLHLEHLIVAGGSVVPEVFGGLSIYFYPKMISAQTGNISYPEFTGEDSVYVYFTSGTTGTPKGIVGKNESLLQFLQWEIAEFGISSRSRFSQFVSPYFDAFLRDVFAPLFANGVICIPPADGDFLTAEKMTRWIDENKVTHIHCVPTLFGVINNESLTDLHFGCLEYIFLSGEKIDPSGLVNWYRIFSDRIQLVNLYGPTETTMIRSSYRIQPEDAQKTRIPVGKPIADTEFLVVANDHKPCDISLVGDLYIITDYMTKGYLNAPPSDRERFGQIEYDGRLRKAFRTGDRARKLPGGNFELIGREDRQVKLWGIRVELDEIEAILCQEPGVKQAVVIHHENNLAAFVTRKRPEVDPAQFIVALEAHAKLRLPKYMVPSPIVEVTEFLLLPNGKINYGALVEQLKATCREIVQPIHPAERQLLGIWMEILGNKPISTEDNFHTIGGNSLGMMRLIGKIYKQFGVRISLSQLFKNLTIKQQARLVDQTGGDNVMTIEKAGKLDLYPLSAAQERIYYNYQLNTAGTAYNLPFAWEIHEGEIGKIESAIDKLVMRHESLRTQFRFEGNQVFQTILENVPFSITRLYCDNSTEDIRRALLNFIQPFDLSCAPLFRAAQIFAGEERRILIIDTHHIVCDGMSQVNLLSEFWQLIHDKELPPFKVQYKDYAEWERKFKQSAAYLAQREFWLKSFEGGIPKLQLPVTVQDQQAPEMDGASIGFSIENQLMHPITEALKANGITEFSGMFAVYFIFLSQISGQDDIVIGTNTSGRIQEEVMGLVGMFAKTLPIRLQLHPDLSFLEFAKVVNQQLIEANSHQLYDLSDIVTELKLKHMKASELFSAMFVFQNFERGWKKAEGIRFAEFEIENTTAKYPLSLFVSIGECGYQFRLEYSTQSFSAYDIQLLVGKFKGLIKALSEGPDQKVIDCWEQESEMDTIAEDIVFNF
jgi:mycobactin peptide synthetase MbtE